MEQHTIQRELRAEIDFINARITGATINDEQERGDMDVNHIAYVRQRMSNNAKPTLTYIAQNVRNDYETEKIYKTPDDRLELNAYNAFVGGKTLAPFRPSNGDVEYSSWMSIFERFSEDLCKRSRINGLVTYLADNALTWYADENADDTTLLRPETKSKFLSRYGTNDMDPAVSAEQLRLTRNETVKE